MWWIVILWLIAGVLTIINDDKQTLKFNYIITWIVLMIYLVDKYVIA